MTRQPTGGIFTYQSASGHAIVLDDARIAALTKIGNLDLGAFTDTPKDATDYNATRDRLAEQILEDITVHIEVLVPDSAVRKAITHDYLTGLAWRWPLRPKRIRFVHSGNVGFEASATHRHTLEQWAYFPPEAAPLAVAHWVKDRAGIYRKGVKVALRDRIDPLVRWAEEIIEGLSRGHFHPHIRSGGMFRYNLEPTQGAPSRAKQEVVQWTQRETSESLEVLQKDPEQPNVLDKVIAFVRSADDTAIPSLPMGREVRFTLTSCALVYLAEQEIEENRRIPRAAISTTSTHHGMLQSFDELKLNEDGTLNIREDAVRIYLTQDGKPEQLVLPLNKLGLHEEVIKALKDRLKMKDFYRHWLAFHSQLHNEGGRAGIVRWTSDQHFDAMGIHDERTRDKHRHDVTKFYQGLTSIRLVVEPSSDRKGRFRRSIELPIIQAWATEKKTDTWDIEADTIEGAWLGLNPLLYEGVRKESGKLGTDFFTVPDALPKVDHRRHPYAHALGTHLAFRLRWDIGDAIAEGRDWQWLRYSAQTLLDLAGIPQSRPERMWERLKSTLDKLVEVGQLGKWHWFDGRTQRTPDGIVVLYISQWLRESMIHGIPPLESRPPKVPLTGDELKAERERLGWSQAELARHLRVSRNTIGNNEGRGARRLGRRIIDRLTAQPLPR